MIRVRLQDNDLQTTRLRGLGFQAECSCGWKGDRWRRMDTARLEMRWHARVAHAR